MKYEITNSSPRGKAFKVFGGTEVVKAGETKTVDIEGELADEQIEAFSRDDVTITQTDASDVESAPQAPASTEPQPLRVQDKGRGWFVVMSGDEEVTKSLRADDVEEFDRLSDEDKAAFIDLHKAD